MHKNCTYFKVFELIVFLPVCCLLINCIGKPFFLLKQMLLPDIRHVSGTEFFVFQQDSAHLTEPRKQLHSCTVNDWDTWSYSAYVVASELPGPQSCWLLCLECATRTCLLYCTKVDNVVDLKQHIVAEWAALDHSIIASAIAQWHLRLHACVLAAGEHCEHCLHSAVTLSTLHVINTD